MSGFEERFGIRSQKTRSQPTKKWWARRWHDYMEECRMGVRIGRGRQYAMSGNVRSLEISPGLVEARVKGSEDTPYLCRIRCDALGEAGSAAIAAFFRERPMLLAQLLIGNLPEQVETRFRASGVPLVPSSVAPLSVECNCPDNAEFCKHAAAVMFILGELFEQDPLLLLNFRGLRKEAIFGDPPLGAEGGAATTPTKAHSVADSGTDFWGSGGIPALEFSTQGCDEPLPKKLGTLPFWRGECRFVDTLTECIAQARRQIE